MKIEVKESEINIKFLENLIPFLPVDLVVGKFSGEIQAVVNGKVVYSGNLEHLFGPKLVIVTKDNISKKIGFVDLKKYIGNQIVKLEWDGYVIEKFQIDMFHNYYIDNLNVEFTDGFWIMMKPKDIVEVVRNNYGVTLDRFPYLPARYYPDPTIRNKLLSLESYLIELK